MEPNASGIRPTMDLTDVRRHHLSVVLEHLLRAGPRSRAAIAGDIGLTKSTVSALVADLLERGLVEELETPRTGRVGSPAIDVGAAGRYVGALGLQIDVDEVAACVIDLSGEVRVLRRRRAGNRDAPAKRVIRRLRDVAREAVEAAADAGIRCIGGTLALPGLVDQRSATLFVAPNLHWFDADLGSLVPDLGMPEGLAISVDNEANLGALAELRYGADRELSSFVYVSGGSGLGAGIVLDQRLLRGFAGELGHIVVDPAGRQCACGACGCLEVSIADAPAAALAAALRTVVHLIDPEAVVLGGTLAALGDDVVAEVADRLNATTLGGRWHPCDIRRSALGPDAALLGAASAALDTVIADPTIVALRPSSQSA